MQRRNTPTVTPAADRRIDRARELARRYPASAEILNFYAELTEFQKTLTDDRPAEIGDLAPRVLAWLRTCSNVGLAQAAENLQSNPTHDWRELFDAYLGHDARLRSLCELRRDRLTDIHLFVVEAGLQPVLERAASGLPAPTAQTRECPSCRNRPVVSALRERGHSGERSLVCGLCLIEWPARRLACPACGETGFEALPVYRAEEFAGVRIDACETCRRYLKTIDLTVIGAAIPVVDDLASLPLDLWAQQQGYTRLRKNILRM